MTYQAPISGLSTAAPNRWPYFDHRTLAEIQHDQGVAEVRHARLLELLERGRYRPLRSSEQRELSDLIEMGAGA